MIKNKTGNEITADDLHIWVIPPLLAMPDEQRAFTETNSCVQQLSHQERQRAKRFSHPDSRYDYIYTRLAMRIILAGYINTSASELALDTRAMGKPLLKQGIYPVDLRFNLSHTQGLALLAVANGQEVGIDIEKMGRQRKIMALALRYFAQSTTSKLATLSAERQEEAFLYLWTQFEAFKKAKGEGLRGGDKAHLRTSSFITCYPKAMRSKTGRPPCSISKAMSGTSPASLPSGVPGSGIFNLDRYWNSGIKAAANTKIPW